MHCDQMEELIAAYADGELQGEQKQQLEAHLAECPHCADLYREYLALNEALACCEKRAPEDLCDKVMQTIHQQNAVPVKQPRGIRLGRAAGWIGVGVAAMLCISVATTALVRHMVLNAGNGDVDAVPQEPLTTEDGNFMPEEITMPEHMMPSDDEAMTPEAPSMEEPTAENATMEEITTEELPMDGTTAEDATMEETEAEGTTREPAGADPQETVAPQESEPEATQPEIEDPSGGQATEIPTEEGGGKDDESVEDSYPTYEPDLDEETEIAPENNATKGWLGRMLEAIGDFFARLWQSIVSLFGGGKHA